MGERGPHIRLSQLWQLPALLLSLALFGVAGYLLIDPQPGITIEHRIDLARMYLRQQRPEAAVDYLNRLLGSEKLEPHRQAQVHLLLAEALEMGQQRTRLVIPLNHERIIEQTRYALALGAQPDSAVHRRLARSFEALGESAEALAHYRRAMAMDADVSLEMQRRVVELQLATGLHGAAEVALDSFIDSPDATDVERAWAMSEKAQLLIDRGQFIAARALLREARRLDMEPVSQGVIAYRLAKCAWELSDIEEAERLLAMSRDLLRGQHPLDAEAALLLGMICRQRGDLAMAIAHFDAVLTVGPEPAAVARARLGRGMCRIVTEEDERGLADLHELASVISQFSLTGGIREEALAEIRHAGDLLEARGNHRGALEAVMLEQSLHGEHVPPALLARLARAYERRADQLERSSAAATPADHVRQVQEARALRIQAADAYLLHARAIAHVDAEVRGESMRRAFELYRQAGDLPRLLSAMELLKLEGAEAGNGQKGEAYAAHDHH